MSSSTTASRSESTELEPLGPIARLRLALEILAAYPRALRLVRGNDLRAMVEAARDVEPVPHREPPELEHVLAIRLGVAVQRTLKPVPTDSRCLVRSVVLSRLLARRQIESRLVIGVKTDQEFAAHAWVEHDGVHVLPRGGHHRLMDL
jgi:hypothetical protein